MLHFLQLSREKGLENKDQKKRSLSVHRCFLRISYFRFSVRENRKVFI